MSRILLRAAVSAVLLSASDARKVNPDGQALLSTATDLDSRSTLKGKAMATADDAVREAEAELAKEMSAAETEAKTEEKVEEKNKEKKVVQRKPAQADEDFVKDGDDQETVAEDEKEEDDEEEASEEAGTGDKTEKKDKGGKKETTKAAKKDDKQKESSKAAKTDDKKTESKPVAKSDAEPKKSKDAKSDKKEDDKTDAKDATQGKKKEAAKQDKKDQNKTGTKVETQNKTAEKAQVKKQPMPKFGNPKCPCVGLEGVNGDLTVYIGGNKTASYPADAFASCAAWDADSHPGCQKDKDGTSWCHQPWCLVDPCNCEIDIAPKKVTGGYWPDGDLQGMGGYWYSYATCGGKDGWADEASQKKMADAPKECNKTVDETKWGDMGCQCIGIAGRLGNVDVQISENVTASYPIDAGATCKAWDMEHHPDCQGLHPAPWCEQVWCYVDPCSCAIPVSPKVSSYMTDATWSGTPVYYSYDTCGGNDTYTKSQENACVNQQSDEECGNQSRCAWDGQQCLGKELVKVCKNAAKADANATDVQEQAELDEAVEEKGERTAAKKGQEKSGALLPAAPFLATFLAFVASSS